MNFLPVGKSLSYLVSGSVSGETRAIYSTFDVFSIARWTGNLFMAAGEFDLNTKPISCRKKRFETNKHARPWRAAASRVRYIMWIFYYELAWLMGWGEENNRGSRARVYVCLFLFLTEMKIRFFFHSSRFHEKIITFLSVFVFNPVSDRGSYLVNFTL